MALLWNRGQIALKVKTTRGASFPSMTGAEVLLEIFNFETPTYTVDRTERRPANPNVGPLADIVGGAYGEVKFSMELRGSGAAGTAPVFAAALTSCGLDETIDAGVSVTYVPSSTLETYASGGPTLCDIAWYQDGIVHQLADCAGTFEIVGERGKPAMINFTFTGKKNANPAAASLIASLLSYSTVVPPTMTGVALTVGGSSPGCWTNFSFDIGAQVSVVECASAASGYDGGRITDFMPTGSIDPEPATTTAYVANYTALFAGSTSAISVPIGATAGNICTIGILNAQRTDVTGADSNGIVRQTLPFKAVSDVDHGDALFSLAFT